MLRFDHMPSDFNPMFLFLGDSRDLSALAGLLRAFAQAPRELDVGEQLCARSRSRLMIVPIAAEGGAFGLRPAARHGFQWGLNAWQAEQIAARIERLTPVKSGSDIIELGVEGEIPVKVSRGEFTDDFLISKR